MLASVMPKKEQKSTKKKKHEKKRMRPARIGEFLLFLGFFMHHTGKPRDVFAMGVFVGEGWMCL
jgi:hypothetical protein